HVCIIVSLKTHFGRDARTLRAPNQANQFTCRLRQIAPLHSVSLIVGEPAHFLQPSQAIFPVHHLDEVPHDQTPWSINGADWHDMVSGLLPRPGKWLRARLGILHAIRRRRKTLTVRGLFLIARRVSS